MEDLLKNYHKKMCDRAFETMQRKNHDYSGGNIHPDPFVNFRGSEMFGVNPIKGILMRMTDKMMRITTFADKGILEVSEENIDNAIEDIVNYAILIGAMIEYDKTNNRLKDSFNSLN